MASLFHRPDKRDWFLILIGALSLLIGYGYILAATPPSVRNPLTLALKIMPLWVWGAVWVAAGLYCIFAGLTDRRVGGFTIAPAMPIMWGVWYLLGWLDGDAPRGWITTGIFWALAGAVISVAGLTDPRPIATPKGQP
jgi:hypothetical protein